MKKAVVLISGGMDSTTVLAMAKKEGYKIYALSFAYGQRHIAEIHRIKRIADSFGVAGLKIMNIDLRQIGGSALTADLPVPKGKGLEDGIPITYVPARNTIFLSFALAWAEVIGAEDIFIGVNAVDYSGYPDCRPEFIAAFENLANLATREACMGRMRFRIRAPLLAMSKAEIIKKGIELGVDYSLTHSCYDPDEEGRACGRCSSCQLRLKGFAEAGLHDPAPYQDVIWSGEG